jgi:hypothetical protein
MTPTFNPRANIANALTAPDRSIQVKPPPRSPNPVQQPEQQPTTTERVHDKSATPSSEPASSDDEQASEKQSAARNPGVTNRPRQTRRLTANAGDPASLPTSGMRAVPGTRNGRLRIITVTIPANARKILEREMSATGRSRGQVVMTAVRSTYEEIGTEFTVGDSEPDSLFGTPRVVKRRRHLDDPRAVPLYVAEPEARGLGELKERVTLSLSAIITEALERHYKPN